MESFVQGADTGWARTGGAIAAEVAGKKMESVRGALLCFVKRLPALLNPKSQLPAATTGALSQAALLLLKSFFPAPPNSKAWTFVPLFFSPPAQRRSPALGCARALSRAAAGPCPHMPGPWAGTAPSSCSTRTPGATPPAPPQQPPAAFYFLKYGGKEGKKFKKAIHTNC